MPRNPIRYILALLLLACIHLVSVNAQTPKSRFQGTWSLSYNDGCVDVSYLLTITESKGGLSAKVTELDGQGTGISIRSLKEEPQGTLTFMVDAEGYFDLKGTLSLRKDSEDRFTGMVGSDTQVEGARKEMTH